MRTLVIWASRPTYIAYEHKRIKKFENAQSLSDALQCTGSGTNKFLYGVNHRIKVLFFNVRHVYQVWLIFFHAPMTFRAEANTTNIL